VFEFLFPPIVTGSIVALIGLNLAPVAWQQFEQQAGLGMITLVAILIIGVAVKSFLSRMSVFLGVVVGYVFAALLGDVNWDGVNAASWFGFPDFITPDFNMRAILLVVPGVLLVLMAENAGHVKAVATMTERDLDPLIGRSFMGDGVATTLSGLFGGSGTTTYAENIGVMGYTRIYSTLAYLIAGAIAIGLGLLPKFGAIITAIPIGVLGGAVTVLFGMIAVLGARIWIEADVNFRDPVNLVTAAVALIVGTANYTLNWGDYSFGGIALGTIGATVIYQVLRLFQPEEPPPAGAIGDSLVEPLAAAPDPRRP
jgi:uracil-xanthine permease